MKDELKIGIFVGIGLFILAFLIIAIGDVKLGQGGYTFTIRFNYISGIRDGAPVMVSGMDAGCVKGLYLKNNKVYVKVWVKKDVEIPSDSMITINTLGLLGEKYVEITLGKSRSVVKNGDFLVGINPVNVSEILERSEIVVYKMERTVTILDKLMGEKEMLLNLENSLKNLAIITKDSSEIISKNKREIIEAINNISIASKAIADITKENKENIRSCIVELKEASLSLQKTAKSIDREALSNSISNFNKATERFNKIAGVVKPDELKSAIASFNEAADNLNTILKKNEKSISEGASSFNKAMTDLRRLIEEVEKGSASITEASKSLSNTGKNLEELSADLKKNPWKLFKKH
ncbi:MAG: MlaD family protein [bacterium]